MTAGGACGAGSGKRSLRAEPACRAAASRVWIAVSAGGRASRPCLPRDVCSAAPPAVVVGPGGERGVPGGPDPERLGGGCFQPATPPNPQPQGGDSEAGRASRARHTV